MQERNVTRAGHRIGLAQPSMSSALTRLRHLFNDELFVRSASGMQPTAVAIEAGIAVSEALRHIRTALDRDAEFDHAKTNHRFSVGVTDYGDVVVVPALIEAMRRDAPNANLVVRPITSVSESVIALERGDVDLLIGGHLPLSSRTIRHTLFTERFVCIRNGAHASNQTMISLKDYLDLPHVLFSAVGGDGAPGVVDRLLSERDLKRRVAVSLPHIVAVPFAVSGTDLLATMAERVAARFAQTAGVTILPLPFELETFPIEMLQAKNSLKNKATSWLSHLVETVCQTRIAGP